jgi:hypothetical protein
MTTGTGQPRAEVNDDWTPSALYFAPLVEKQRLMLKVDNNKVAGRNAQVAKIQGMAEMTKEKFACLWREGALEELLVWASQNPVAPLDLKRRMEEWRATHASH